MMPKRFWFILLVLAGLVSGTSASARTFPLTLPEEGIASEYAVPIEVAVDVATAEARRVWGHVVLGPVIPCCDAEDRSIAYYVCFRIGEKPFPAFDEVLDSILAGRALRLEGLRELSLSGAPPTPIAVGSRRSAGIPEGKSLTYELGRRATWGIGEYGTILVSGQYTMGPIPEYFDGLPRFFTLADKIADAARTELGDTPILSRVLFGGRLSQVFEFHTGTDTVYVDPFPCVKITPSELERLVPSPVRGCEPDPALVDSFASAWQEFEAGEVPARSTHRIDHWDWVPIFLWTGGCTPTACSMVFGFWDNKQPSGFYGGYGRLVDYYRDEHKCPDASQCPGSPCWGMPGDLRMNIPSCLDELRADLNTSACGNTAPDDIAPGMEAFANTSPNSYNFSIVETKDSWIPFTPGWDCCWGAITAEIDADYPFHWVIGYWSGSAYVGHSLAAWGYTDDKYIGVYNTWDEQEHWWCHDKYGNNCNYDADDTWVFAARPGGGQYPNDLYLYGPNGGESWDACDPHTIQWYQYGSTIARVTISYSTNAGADWSTLVSSCSSSGQGWHTYEWTPMNAVAGSETRVQVIGKDSAGNTVAAEGSYGNFSIEESNIGGPTNCAATTNRCDGINVSWSWSGSNQDGFRIRRDGTLVHTGSNPSERSWLDTGCSTGSHYYAILAYNYCEDGPSCGTTGSRPAPVSGAPTSCTASTDRCDGINVSWSWSGSNQDGFRIRRDGALVHIGTSAAERTWLDTGCSSGSHDYAILAYNDCGDGPSCEATGSRLVPVSGALTNCTASTDRCDGINVSWEWVGSGVIGFHVERDGVQVHEGTDSAERTWFDSSCSGGEHDYAIYAYGLCGNGPGCVTVGTKVDEDVVLLFPNGGEAWIAGQTAEISWEPNPCVPAVDIELSRTGGSEPWEPLVMNVPNDGTELWPVIGPASAACVLRVSDSVDQDPSDESDDPFVILESLSVWHVATSGSDATGLGTAAQPFATIQYGVNVAASGDTVLVAPGTYVGELNRDIYCSGGNLVIQSEAGSEFTFIDAEGAAPCFTIDGTAGGPPETYVIAGFTLRAGFPSSGGSGVDCFNAAVEITDVVFVDHVAPNGVVYCFDTWLTIDNVRFEPPSLPYEYSAMGVCCKASQVTILHTSFEGLDCGAVECTDSTLSISDCSFADNRSAFDFGALYCSNSVVDIGNTTFQGNTSTSGAGAMVCDASEASLSGVVFRGNHTTHGTGGLLCTNAAVPVLTDCRFVSNDGSVGGMTCAGGSDAVLTDVTFKWNTALSGDGAMRCEDSSPTLADVAFIENMACLRAPALAVEGNSSPTLERVIFVGNVDTEHTGNPGAMGCYDGASPVLRNCTFLANRTYGIGAAIMCSWSSVVLEECIVAFTEEGSGLFCHEATGTTITQSCFFGNAGGDSLCGDHSDNLFLDPLFCDSADTLATLRDDSPCLPENNQWSAQIGACGEGCSRPEVMAVSPPPHVLGADPTATITVAFNDDISLATISETTLVVTSNRRGRLARSVGYNPTTRTASLSPDSDMLPSETISVVLTDSVLSTSGMPLRPFGWTFSVATEPSDAQFSDAPGMSPMTVDGGARFADLGDLDADGWLDLAVTDHAAGGIRLFSGTDAPAFIPPDGLWMAVGAAPEVIAFFDANSDAHLDVAVANRDDSTVSILLGTGGIGFVEALGSPHAVGAGPRALTTCDLNLDGHADVVTPSWNEQTLTVLWGDGTGQFAEAPHSPILLNPCEQINTVRTGDFDADGFPDILVLEGELDSTTAPGRLHVLLSDSGQGYVEAPGSPFSSVVERPYDIETGDVDSDGCLDVLVLGRWDSRVLVMLGDSSGGLTASFFTSVSEWPRCMRCGDLNGDGILDVATGGVMHNRVTILLGNGVGGFIEAPMSPIDVGDEPCSITLGDLGGDGDADLIVANYVGESVSILWNGAESGTGVDGNTTLPSILTIVTCWPNPFNPSIEILYSSPSTQHVALDIYGATGKLVRRLIDAETRRGRHRVTWDGTDSGGRTVASGIYFARLRSTEGEDTAKLVLLK